MLNVNYWMTNVKHISDYGGDCISEIMEMRACQSIPLVNELYYNTEPFHIYPAKTYYPNKEATGDAWEEVKNNVDVLHIRGIDPFRTIRPRTNKPIIYFGSPLEKDAFEQSDAVEVFAPCWKQWLVEDYAVPEDKIYVIPQAVDTDVFKKMDARSLRDRYDCDILLGYVGSTQQTYLRVYLNKLMKRLLKHNPRTHLVILTYELQKNKYLLFDDATMGHVSVHSVPHDEIPMWYNAFDIVLCLGTAPYAGNMKEVECQACECPTVAFNLDNRRYRFGEDYPYLAKIKKFKGLRMENPDYNETDLVRKITYLMDNPKERDLIGKRNRVQAEKFSIRNVGKMIMKMYGEIL